MKSIPYDVEAVRSKFPILDSHLKDKPLVYLDSAATALKPIEVVETLSRFYAEQYGTVHRAVYSLAGEATARYNESRVQVKKFIKASSAEEIIFTKGTTEAINLVASSFGQLLSSGDEVIITEMEHHSNIVPWQELCKQRQLTLKYIPMASNGELRMDIFRELLTHRTKLVSVAHIANSTGTINPIEEIISLSHAKGARVFIDGAQSAPHLSIDVQKLDMDFFAFSGHKIYGPTGIGVLYGKKELLEKMPPYQSGSDMIEVVTMEGSTFQPLPLKFEAGTPMIAEVIGLGAAIRFVESIGLQSIAEWEHHLLEHATSKALTIPGLQLIGTSNKKGGILSFVVDGVHPLDIGTLLDVRGFAVRTGHLCAQPALRRLGISACVRASFAVYNTLEEVDAFIDALNEVLDLLR